MIEMRSQLLERASYANQARVHNGYHYPRSFLTGIRSRVNFPRFVDEYNDCIDRAFDSYYAVARRMSNVTASHSSFSAAGSERHSNRHRPPSAICSTPI